MVVSDDLALCLNSEASSYYSDGSGTQIGPEGNPRNFSFELKKKSKNPGPHPSKNKKPNPRREKLTRPSPITNLTHHYN